MRNFWTYLKRQWVYHLGLFISFSMLSSVLIMFDFRPAFTFITITGLLIVWIYQIHNGYKQMVDNPIFHLGPKKFFYLVKLNQYIVDNRINTMYISREIKKLIDSNDMYEFFVGIGTCNIIVDPYRKGIKDFGLTRKNEFIVVEDILCE